MILPCPKLGKIEKLLESGEPFSLTNTQYKQKTGLDIPKNRSYLVNSSAVSKLAKEKGFKIVVQELKITFEKETV